MAKTIRDLMTSDPKVVEPDRPVAEAAKLMKQEDVGIVPIVDDQNHLVGTITDRDITVRVVAEEKDPKSTTVSEIASQSPITVEPQQDLHEALRLMAQHQVRRLPVVGEDGKLVGIVAQADVAREGEDARTGEVVQQISR
jgi:CBS domain-containing protein